MQKLHALLVALAAFAAAGCSAVPSTPRNVVVVSLDTLRADHLGLYGYAKDTSPQLDRWAASAFVFENAVSAANYTLASHHALFQSRNASAARESRHDAPTLAVILKEGGFRTAGFTGGGMMTEMSGFARGFDVWDEDNEELADAVPKALAFLDEAARQDARFYLFVHCLDVHLPYDPPPPYDSLFAPEYRGSVGGNETRLLLSMRKMFEGRKRFGKHRFDAADKAKVIALYDGEIARMDATLSPLLARLDAPDLQGDTLVVILSDHGEEFWDHGSVLHAHTVFQELVHVPLLLRLPALAREARRIDRRVSLLDVTPTLLDLLALQAPEGMRGRSLVPLLRGEAPPVVPIFAESFGVDAKLQTVIDGDLKLIRDLDTGAFVLFDLEADPDERNDLAQSRPEEASRLLALLDAELGTERVIGDPFPMPTDLEPETRERLRALGYID